MADTQRTRTDLLTNLFQDGQAANSITAQDMRDLIESLMAPHGSASLTANTTATTVAAGSVFYDVAGTWTVGGNPLFVTEATTGRLTYLGTATKCFMVTSTASMTSGSSNQATNWAIAKNGTAVAPMIGRKIGTGSDEGAVAVSACIMLATNDYVQLQMSNDTGANNVTATEASIQMIGMPT
jgi:hypothetical protein